MCFKFLFVHLRSNLDYCLIFNSNTKLNRNLCYGKILRKFLLLKKL